MDKKKLAIAAAVGAVAGVVGYQTGKWEICEKEKQPGNLKIRMSRGILINRVSTRIHKTSTGFLLRTACDYCPIADNAGDGGISKGKARIPYVIYTGSSRNR